MEILHPNAYYPRLWQLLNERRVGNATLLLIVCGNSGTILEEWAMVTTSKVQARQYFESRSLSVGTPPYVGYPICPSRY